MKKGISLIVLVITIVVMIILAGSVILTLGNTGIITQANKSAFVSNIKEIMQDYSIYQAMYLADGNTLSDLNASSENIREIIGSIPKDSIYEEKLEIINGTLTYMVNVKDKTDVERATWACEAGLKVNGMSNCTDIEYVETHIPAFEKRGKIYYNTPDLTGFNPEKTFFVTYDDNGNEIIGNNIAGKVPEDWFDYENKEWANIVTINGALKSYFVWIPRYVYKVDDANNVVDVRFVNNSNVYIAEDGTKTTYNDTAPVFDADENQTNYVVSSAFYINEGTEEEPEIRQMSGFWMSKYELSENIGITQITNIVGTNYIEITSVTHTGAAKFDYYLDDKLIQADAGITYKYENLLHDRTYAVKIVPKSSVGEEFNAYETGITTLGENTKGITGFPADSYQDKIVVYSTTLTDLASQNSIKTYEFYLDDKLITTNTTGIYTFDGLIPETTYKVTIKLKDTGIYYGEYTRTFTTPSTNVIYGNANDPELGTLLKFGTYYLTWDDDGNEIRTEVVDASGNAVAAPNNWYDYDNKEWANIVVVNETLGAETYLVWIPRYEYRVVGAESTKDDEQYVDIAFVPTTKLEATTGYILHPSFDINMGTDENPNIKHLAGFWMTKYEVSDVLTE